MSSLPKQPTLVLGRVWCNLASRYLLRSRDAGKKSLTHTFCIYRSILILVTIKATQTTCLCSLVDGSAILWENQCISYFGLLIRLCSQMLLWNLSFIFTARVSFNRNLGFQLTPGSSHYSECIQSSSPVTVVFYYTTKIWFLTPRQLQKYDNPEGLHQQDMAALNPNGSLFLHLLFATRFHSLGLSASNFNAGWPPMIRTRKSSGLN